MSTDPPGMRRSVTVHLDGGRSYDVVIGAGVLNEVRPRLDALMARPTRVFIVHDVGVPTAFATPLDRPVGQTTHIFHPSEAHKSPTQLVEILHAISRDRLERSHALVALGGGITGDIAGFAAGVYRRGIPWINCPTTLLAMVTVNVGGMPAMLKNMVGVFHQPRLVVADVLALKSLPDRELRAGLAECIKHALISGAWNDHALFDWTSSKIHAILARDTNALTELVARNVGIKAAVVAADERETGAGHDGGRMSLNLGHTFAHALEAITELGLSHGEAVGLGLLAAAECAERLGRIPAGLRLELDALLASAGLPPRLRSLPPAERVIELMLDDKKVESGSLRLILPAPGRRVEVVSNPPLDAVRGAIDTLRA